MSLPPITLKLSNYDGSLLTSTINLKVAGDTNLINISSIQVNVVSVDDIAPYTSTVRATGTWSSLCSSPIIPKCIFSIRTLSTGQYTTVEVSEPIYYSDDSIICPMPSSITMNNLPTTWLSLKFHSHQSNHVPVTMPTVSSAPTIQSQDIVIDALYPINVVENEILTILGRDFDIYNEGSSTSKRRLEGLGLAGFIITLVNLPFWWLVSMIFGLVAGVLGIIFGSIGIHRTRKHRTTKWGKGFAITSLILGLIMVVVSLILLLILI